MRRPLLFCLITTPLLAGMTALSIAMGVLGPTASLPVWMVLPFAAAGLAGGFGLEATLRSVPYRAPEGRRLALELVLLAAMLLSPALLHPFENVLAFGLFATLGLRLVRSTPVTQNAAALAVGLDFVVEALLVYQGVYSYPDANLAPLPLWLPALWANLGVSAWRLYGRLPAQRPVAVQSSQLG